MISGYENLARATFTCTPTDADTGRLDVAPDPPAYGTKLRWSAPKLIAAANERAPGANVRTLHVYAARPREGRPRHGGRSPAPQPTTPAATVQRRTPQDGYRGALEAHRETAPPRRVDPGTAEAVGRQTRAMREPRQRAFPESGTSSDDQPTPIEAARVQRRRESDATRALALRRGGTRRPGGRRGRPPCRSPLCCEPRSDRSSCREVTVGQPRAREAVGAGQTDRVRMGDPRAARKKTSKSSKRRQQVLARREHVLYPGYVFCSPSEAEQALGGARAGELLAQHGES
ncbi:hypothetical protein ACFRCI_34490 [Streptomyces sp. NPDC056638]|uniref:hypothetical protein n=1 Tax=Streptomyces sp. NPDC056638 TaxID=3345887 RepID=UPI0036CDCA8A